jgi:hypothetical protein
MLYHQGRDCSRKAGSLLLPRCCGLHLCGRLWALLFFGWVAEARLEGLGTGAVWTAGGVMSGWPRERDLAMLLVSVCCGRAPGPVTG